MSYYVVERDPARFPFGNTTSIKADAVDLSNPEIVRFVRDEQTCFQAPAADIRKVTEHATHLEAEEHLKELRRWRSGRSTVHVQEGSGSAPAPRKRRGDQGKGGSAVPAEGITFRVNET